MAQAPTTYRPSVYPLSKEQIAQILKDSNRVGWDTNGMVVEETELKTNTNTGLTDQVPTGQYTLLVAGPGGTTDKIVLTRGEDVAGGGPGPGGVPGLTPSFVVQGAAAKPPKPEEPPKADTHTDPWGGVYEKVDGVWKPVIQGSQAKAGGEIVSTAKSQAEYDQMVKNEAAGRGFMSDKDWHDIQLAYSRNELNANELKEKIRQFDEKNKIDWAAERRLGGTAEAQNRLTTAQATGVGVETRLNEERLKQLIAAAPTTQEKARLENELITLQQQEARNKLNQPTSFSLGQDMTYGVMTPGGEIQERYRQGYVPKTMADVAARRGQLSQLGLAKRDELMAKSAKDPQGYTAEQAFADFNTWYDRNIAPQIPALQAAEEEAQVSRGKEQATMRQAALTAAQGAGSQAISAYNAQNPNVVTPGWAEEMGKVWNATSRGERAGPIDYTKALVREEADLSQSAAQATAQALKYVDPTAAELAGAPKPADYTSLNPAEVLDRSKLFYGANGPQTVPAGPAPGAGGPAGPAPGAGVPAAPVGPATNRNIAVAQIPGLESGALRQGTGPYGSAVAGVPVPATGAEDDWYQQYQARNAADIALQQRQAQVGTNLQALLDQIKKNNVYTYGGA